MEKIVKLRYFPQRVLKIKCFVPLTFVLWFLLSLPRSTGKNERKVSLLVSISQWLAIVCLQPGHGFCYRMLCGLPCHLSQTALTLDRDGGQKPFRSTEQCGSHSVCFETFWVGSSQTSQKGISGWGLESEQHFSEDEKDLCYQPFTLGTLSGLALIL